MRRHLNSFVKNDVFSNRKPPPKTRRRFYPANKDITNYMQRTRNSQRRSKIDQDNLSILIKKWKKESPQDLFYFRPYAESESASEQDVDEFQADAKKGTSVSLLSNLIQGRRNLDQQSRKILELNKEKCPSYCRVFNEIQNKLKNIAGYDDMITGMLSKSKGQILPVAGVFSVLFEIGLENVTEEITDVALAAAINFVELSCDHAFFLASRSSVKDEIESVLLEATSAIPLDEEEQQPSAAVKNHKRAISYCCQGNDCSSVLCLRRKNFVDMPKKMEF
ncbi:hypothetical protein AC249_AIPGENE10238 [Exaiptasia diaphana]|nr:hypothetical protein AC249_AIPGENE10238 [Exaiptasia diaphana]